MESKVSLDASGALLATSSLMLLVLAFSQRTTTVGMDKSTYRCFTGCGRVAAVPVSLVTKRIVKRPLLPLSVFKRAIATYEAQKI